jgi:hypothetical protein
VSDGFPETVFIEDALELPLSELQRQIRLRLLLFGCAQLEIVCPRRSLQIATQDQIDRARRSTLPAPPEDE